MALETITKIKEAEELANQAEQNAKSNALKALTDAKSLEAKKVEQMVDNANATANAKISDAKIQVEGFILQGTKEASLQIENLNRLAKSNEKMVIKKIIEDII